MKICWDSLENLRYNKKTGKWYGRGTTFVYKNKCPECGEPYLGRTKLKKNQTVEYCSKACADKNNKGNRGRILSEEHRKKIGTANIGRFVNNETRRKMSKAKKGKKMPKHFANNISKRMKMLHKLDDGPFNNDWKKKLSEVKKGRKRPDMTGENHPLYGKSRQEEENPNWKGGYRKNGLPRYDTYKRLGIYESIRRNPNDKNVLNVKCCVCNKWFTPSLSIVCDRLATVEKGNRKVYNFYCSDRCRNNCGIYMKKKYRKGYEPKISYPKEWNIIREDIKERDGHKCQNSLCGLNIEDSYNITVHHIDYDKENLRKSNLITLCRSCNSKANKDKEWHISFYKDLMKRKLLEEL